MYEAVDIIYTSLCKVRVTKGSAQKVHHFLKLCNLQCFIEFAVSLHLELIEAWLPCRGCTIIFENPLTKQPIDSDDVRVLAVLLAKKDARIVVCVRAGCVSKSESIWNLGDFPTL